MFNDLAYTRSPASIITYIPQSRFDERGRQLNFVESDFQRQQRRALLKDTQSWLASLDSPCSSPSSAGSRSLCSSPSSSPYAHVIDISASPEPLSLSPGYTIPTFPEAPVSRSPPSSTSSFKRGHRRQSSTVLNVIPEED